MKTDNSITLKENHNKTSTFLNNNNNIEISKNYLEEDSQSKDTYTEKNINNIDQMISHGNYFIFNFLINF